MKTLINLVLACTLLALPGAFAQADATTALQETVETFYAALNNADVDTARKHILPEGFTEYSSRGGALLHVDADILEEMFAGDLKVSVALEEINVKVYGDSGYVTFHRIGTIDRGGANKPQDKDARTSMFWIKRDGTWYLLHLHNSNIAP
ncbi:MAG: nuclear transport factor 2 family protein [Porticoccaceae bacterium]